MGVLPFTIGSETYPGLAKVLEESGEAGQAIGRLIQGFGLGMPTHWDGSNHEVRVAEELADLSAAIQFFIYANPRHAELFFARETEKLVKFNEWHAAQRKAKPPG